MSSNLNQTLEQYKEKIISQLQDRLKEEKLFATGNLYTSFYGEVIGDSQLTIYSSAKYAEAVEKGINPGYRPPKSKIEDWARSKNITPTEGSFSNMVNSIRQSIYKFGTIQRYNYEGSKFIDYVAKNIIASLTKDIETSYLKDLNNAIDGNS
jgi:hypothetical protein